MKYAIATAAAFAAVLLAGTVQAAEIKIEMLNKGEKGAMVFQPDYVVAQPGDTITFVPTDKSHDAQSIKDMIPEGATPFKGKISEAVSFTVDKEGVYGVKCAPHYGMGMVALIVVGNPANLEQAKTIKHPGKAKKAFEALLAQVPAGN